MNQEDEEIADFIELIGGNDCQVQEVTEKV